MTESPTAWIDDLLERPSVFTNASLHGVNRQKDYFAQPFSRGDAKYVMSRSDLCEFDICPARWRNGYREDGSESTEWGDLIDCMVLSPDEYVRRYAVKPEHYEAPSGVKKKWRGNAVACQKWEAEHEGMEQVSHALAARATEAVMALEADEQIKALVRVSHRQVMVTGYYTDKATGITVPLKGLIDLVPPADFLADLKTCGSAKPRAWEKAVFDYNYHVQAALYLDLYNAATGEKRAEFRHILQENYKPWQVAKRILSPEFIALGRDKYQRILKRYAECLKTGHFPDYDEPQNHDVVIDGWKVVTPKDWMVLTT